MIIICVLLKIISSEILRRDNERALKWAEMYKNWDVWVASKSSKIKSRIRKGIPDGLRVFIYQNLLGSVALNAANKNLYANLLFDQKFETDVLQLVF